MKSKCSLGTRVLLVCEKCCSFCWFRMQGMRALKTWAEVMAFFIADHILVHIVSAVPLSNTSNSRTLDVMVKIGGGEDAVTVSAQCTLSDGAGAGEGSGGASVNDKTNTGLGDVINSNTEKAAKAVAASATTTTTALPPLELVSHDGTIFYPKSPSSPSSPSTFSSDNNGNSTSVSSDNNGDPNDYKNKNSRGAESADSVMVDSNLVSRVFSFTARPAPLSHTHLPWSSLALNLILR